MGEMIFTRPAGLGRKECEVTVGFSVLRLAMAFSKVHPFILATKFFFTQGTLSHLNSFLQEQAALLAL